jgi:signal recognition particle receptor subunit beta
VLSRADGVVFVADADRTQETNNAESFQSMTDNCHRVGLDFEHLPLVVQFNKCDLPTPCPRRKSASAGALRRGRWFCHCLHGQGSPRPSAPC